MGKKTNSGKGGKNKAGAKAASAGAVNRKEEARTDALSPAAPPTLDPFASTAPEPADETVDETIPPDPESQSADAETSEADGEADELDDEAGEGEEPEPEPEPEPAKKPRGGGGGKGKKAAAAAAPELEFDDSSPAAVIARHQAQLKVIDKELKAIGDPMEESRRMHKLRDEAVEARRLAIDEHDRLVGDAQAAARQVHYEVCVPAEGRRHKLQMARDRIVEELGRLGAGEGE